MVLYFVFFILCAILTSEVEVFSLLIQPHLNRNCPFLLVCKCKLQYEYDTNQTNVFALFLFLKFCSCLGRLLLDSTGSHETAITKIRHSYLVILLGVVSWKTS